LAESSAAVGRTLRELDVRGRTGAMVLSITRATGQPVEGVPRGGERLAAGDILVLAGTAEAVNAARAALSGTK
jgi:monovalent cation:H+ antiporter-2, CPA2 family